MSAFFLKKCSFSAKNYLFLFFLAEYFFGKMSKRKQKKLADLQQMPNVFQNFNWEAAELQNYKGEKVHFQGNWSEKVFKNNAPIVLELGCGYGEYTMAMAQQFPEVNFIGIDIKGPRLWTGAKYLLDNQLDNAVFIRSNVELVPQIFAPNEISEIWIPFPDPYSRKSKSQKRLTSERFLKYYEQILIPDGLLHLKTDSDLLYEFTLKTIDALNCRLLINYKDVYKEHPNKNDVLNVKTRYEQLNLSGADSIKYVRFQLWGKVDS